jgi:dimeric dUTPase (all-alpha-NTP-PPase superfamily)
LQLALLVELGELANEVRSFKFWSIKERSPKDVILEEYVDGIHFIGSLCLANNIDGLFEINDNIKLLSKQDITKQIMNLFYKGTSLHSKDDIKSWYVDYLELGYGLGFSIDEIKKAYFNKNKINFNRQENNY